MPLNFGHQWSVATTNLTVAGTFPDLCFRVTFEVHSQNLGTPPNATVKIYNLSQQSCKKVAMKDKITISAGYAGNCGVIFSGTIVWINIGKENPTDSTLTLFCNGSEMAHNAAHVNTTLKAGSTGLDAFHAIAKSMNLQPGIIPTQDLQQIVYPRANAMFGPARFLMRKLAMSVGATYNYDSINEKVHMTKPDDAGSGGPVILNSETGLIGLPTQTTMGIAARCLINPNIQIHSRVHIDQSSIQGAGYDFGYSGQDKTAPNIAASAGAIRADGVYTVDVITAFGDTFGSDQWCFELNCIDPDHLTNKAAATVGG